MKLNIVAISYLFFRLAPFILICFFALASFFNQDFKGIIYLVGLIVTTFVSSIIGNAFPNMLGYPSSDSMHELCKMVEIGEGQEFSKLPLSLTVYGYTFAYLFYVMVRYKYILQNLPTLFFFPVMIAIDTMWNLRYGCFTTLQAFAAICLSALGGIAWAALFDQFGLSQLQYFHAVQGKDVCSVPKKTTFRCRVFKNGKLIGNI